MITPDLVDTPFGDPHLCWTGKCDDPATTTRYITPTEPVRMCPDHAEAFDDRVQDVLNRLQRARLTPNHHEERKTA